jgi:hypothetical protein
MLYVSAIVDLQILGCLYVLTNRGTNVEVGTALVQKRKSQNINLISHMPCTSPFSKCAIRSETEFLSTRNMYRGIGCTCLKKKKKREGAC